MAYQQGSIYLHGGTWYLKYRTTEKGERLHKTVTLCRRDDLHRSKKSVLPLRDEFMRTVNQENGQKKPSKDMKIVTFWNQYLKHYGEEIVPLTGATRMKPSTLRGYKQIWSQHLKTHFGEMTVQEYTPKIGTRFLRTLAATQCKTTLKHIRALLCSIFKYAVQEEIILVNPIHDVLMPEDAIESASTKHYTIEEAENIISALKEHVDCQLIMALSCFLALRPSEICGCRWEDFDSEYLHIRRAVVRGVLGTPKTKESVADIPLVDQRIIIPLELWRTKCGNPAEGFVFQNGDGGHLHDSGHGRCQENPPGCGQSKVDLEGIVRRETRGLHRCRRSYGRKLRGCSATSAAPIHGYDFERLQKADYRGSIQNWHEAACCQEWR